MFACLPLGGLNGQVLTTSTPCVVITLVLMVLGGNAAEGLPDEKYASSGPAAPRGQHAA
jgi:hypothetical protein